MPLGPWNQTRITVSPAAPGKRCRFCRRLAKAGIDVATAAKVFHIKTCGLCYSRLTIAFIVQRVNGVSTVFSVKPALTPVDITVDTVEKHPLPAGAPVIVNVGHRPCTAFSTGPDDPKVLRWK